MSTPAPLSAKDVNARMSILDSQNGAKEMKTLEEHLQALKKNLESEDSKHIDYISPSDKIMSPCTAKLTFLRNNRNEKIRPKSLFAQASAKKLGFNGDVGDSTKPASIF